MKLIDFTQLKRDCRDGQLWPQKLTLMLLLSLGRRRRGERIVEA